MISDLNISGAKPQAFDERPHRYGTIVVMME
jgi:hypothetical protein